MLDCGPKYRCSLDICASALDSGYSLASCAHAVHNVGADEITRVDPPAPDSKVPLLARTAYAATSTRVVPGSSNGIATLITHSSSRVGVDASGSARASTVADR